ncbi:MAG: hypothetical protein Q8R17_02485 [bacterium]|nr:hypothetical protein [bacterium]
MEIIPAIIPKSAEDLKEKLETLKGLADTVHIDLVVDEPFAKHILQKSSGRAVRFASRAQPDILKMCFASGFSEFIFEAHLMIPHPDEHIAELVKDGFSRILVQVESLSAEAFAELIHEWSGAVEVGAVLKIDTPLSSIDSFAHELKTVQLMSIAEIGAQGRPFDARVLERISALHAKYPHLTIAVDGGVNKKNADKLVAAGATRLVAGSALKEFYG